MQQTSYALSLLVLFFLTLLCTFQLVVIPIYAGIFIYYFDYGILILRSIDICLDPKNRFSVLLTEPDSVARELLDFYSTCQPDYDSAKIPFSRITSREQLTESFRSEIKYNQLFKLSNEAIDSPSLPVSFTYHKYVDLH